MKRNILCLGMLVMALAFGMTVVGCATASTDGDGSQTSKLGQHKAVGTWTMTTTIGETSLTYTYIINGEPFKKEGSYSVTSTKEGETSEDAHPIVGETGSWEVLGGSSELIFTRSDTGEKYIGEIFFKKLVIGRYVYRGNSMVPSGKKTEELLTFTKQ